jgi:hypothetical protein
MLFVLNIFGSFSFRRISKVVLHFTIGINFIGRKLAQENLKKELTTEQIYETIRSFKTGPERDNLSRAIERRLDTLVKIDRKSRDRDDQFMEIVDEVIKEAIDRTDAQLFKNERQRLIKQLGL